MSRKILVTGSTGFLGSELVKSIAGIPATRVIAATRCAGQHHFPDDVTQACVGELGPDTAWHAPLQGAHTVIHTAARVHVMHDTAADPLALFREVNTAGTLNLARQAAQAGVRRFIFISSIKVNGESTGRDEAFRPDDPAHPSDPYAISKHEAELALLALAGTCAMEVVIIRPVLVYGPGVKANFLQLMRLVRQGIPLPLGAINNARSLVSLDNLVDFIRVCIDHPGAANQIFLVSDGHDVSTTELLRSLSAALHKPSLLIPLPVSLMSAAAKLLGKEAVAQRIFGSLEVDISKNQRLLGWVPPVSFPRALDATVKPFLDARKK